jgi:hypothetical protein
MEAKEMRLVDSALYDRIMNLAKKLSQNPPAMEDTKSVVLSLNNSENKLEKLPENLEPKTENLGGKVDSETPLREDQKHATFDVSAQKEQEQQQEKLPEVKQDILGSFPPRFRTRVNRILKFILDCDRLSFNKKYQLTMDEKIYENSNIVDSLSDMLYPIKSLPTIDLQLFYAILNECNMPQTFISNPYRKKLQVEALLFEKPQQEVIERSGGHSRKRTSILPRKVKTKEKTKKLKNFFKQTKSKSKLSKIPQDWLTY